MMISMPSLILSRQKKEIIVNKNYFSYYTKANFETSGSYDPEEKWGEFPNSFFRAGFKASRYFDELWLLKIHNRAF